MSRFFTLLAALAVPLIVQAQPFPAKPLRMVIGFPAGSSSDVVGRLVAQKMSEGLGQQVVFDNRPGASGIIGTDAVAKAPADGHTLLYGYNQLMAINPLLFSKLPYQASDFVPITLVARAGYLILVNPNSKIHTIQDLIAAAKAKPGALAYGSAGHGSALHMAAELFMFMSGTKLTHVP